MKTKDNPFIKKITLIINRQNKAASGIGIGHGQLNLWMWAAGQKLAKRSKLTESTGPRRATAQLATTPPIRSDPKSHIQ